MPYRRLPNTDHTRLTCLKKAVQRASEVNFQDQAIQYHTLMEAQRFLLQFESSVSMYHDNYDTKVSANKRYRHAVQNARMYISHFIQVLNLAVIRGEIKKEQKKLYQLDPNVHTVPDLGNEEELLLWGDRIIKGEMARTGQGGMPIYNPVITKVQVHYDIFKEQYVVIKQHRKIASQSQDNMGDLRTEADRIILDIWNQVEEKYKNLLPYEHLCQCKAYGLIYYYRKGEEKLTAETDKKLKEQASNQTTIQWLH